MKLLIGIDGSEHSRANEDFLLKTLRGDELTTELVSVVPVPSVASYGYENMDLQHKLTESARYQARVDLEQAVGRFKGAGWQPWEVLLEGNPGHEIVARAEKDQADLIALGARGLSGFKKFLLGSVSGNVVRHSPCPVLLHRPSAFSDKDPETLRVMLACDGSEPSDQAIRFLKNVPWYCKIELLIVRVIHLVEAFNVDALQHSSAEWKREVELCQQFLDGTKDVLSKVADSIETQLHQSGNISEEILQVADRWKPELIVVGHQGHGAIKQFLLGSVAYRVAGHAPCSVLVVR